MHKCRLMRQYSICVNVASYNNKSIYVKRVYVNECQCKKCVCVYTLVLVLVWQYHELLELSAVQSAVHVNYTCQLCVRSYAAYSARSGRRSSSAGPCVCVWRLKCRLVIIDYRAGQPVSACSALQCRCRYNCVWPCSRHAMSRYRQLWRSAVVTLMTLATTAVAVTLDRASPCACMRVYTYTLRWLTMPTCAPCRQCTATAAALASVCHSVSGDCC